MIPFIIVVRDFDGSRDYFLNFEAPEVPQIGTYISINRPDAREVGEDLIVRHLWWRFFHPETKGFSENEAVGSLREIMVECDKALGPYSSEGWRSSCEAARARGFEVPEFDVDRMLFPSGPDDD